jgi:hypothetical protein
VNNPLAGIIWHIAGPPGFLSIRAEQPARVSVLTPRPGFLFAGRTLRQIHIQGVSVLRAQVARENARAIRCLAAPGPEDSDVAMEIFNGKQVLCLVFADFDPAAGWVSCAEVIPREILTFRRPF